MGRHGSIAVVERFILTMKTLCTRVILVPVRRKKMREELKHFQLWYNELRPHMTLAAALPTKCTSGGIRVAVTHVWSHDYGGHADRPVPDPASPFAANRVTNSH